MARIPTLDPQVSPRLAADPGLVVPRPSGVGDALVNSMAALQERVGQIAEAERRATYSESQFNLDTETQKWFSENRHGTEPETLPERFKSFYDQRVAHYAGGLKGDDQERFKRSAERAAFGYNATLLEQSIAARTDRLTAALDQRIDALVNDYPSMTGDARAAASLELYSRIDDLEREQILDAKVALNYRTQFIDRTSNGLAAVVLRENPEALLGIDSDPRFEAMDQGDRLTWKIKAETEIERRRREAEAEANRRQREFLADFESYANALSRGVRSTPVLDAQFSDARIEAAVRDPELQRAVKAQRDIALVAQQDVSVLASASPQEMMIYRNAVAQEAGAEVSSVSGATIAAMQGQRLSNIDAAMSKIVSARAADPAGTAMRFNEGVKEQFEAWQQEPSPEAYQDYKTALDQVYTQQGYAPGSPILPKGVAAEIVNGVNSQWATDPETAAAQLDQMAQSMGDDWSRGFSELIAEGMAPEAASVGWVRHSPALQQNLVTIGQNGGMKALKEAVPLDQRNTVDDEIVEGMADFRRAAGVDNRLFTGSMQEAAKILAYDMVARGMDEAEAARTALSEVMDANFTVVNDSYIQGVVDPGVITDEDALGVGAQIWIGAHVGLPDGARVDVPEDVPFAVTQTEGGEWVLIPRKAGGAMLSEEQAIRAATRAGFIDPLSKEPLQRFASEAEAVAAIPGMGPQQMPQPEQLIDIDISMYADRLPAGLRAEDGQEIARKIIANSARLVLTPDGKNAVLVTGAFGLSDEVIGADGNPILVSVEDLTAMGITRRQQLQKQGQPVVRQPGASGASVQQQLMEFQGQGVPTKPVGPGRAGDGGIK